MRPKRARVITLGCKLNQYESSLIEQKLRDSGFAIVRDNSPVDWTIINSCTVTAKADAKSRKLVHRARKDNSRVALVGCLPQTGQIKWVEKSGVEITLGNSNKFSIAEKIDQYESENGNACLKEIPGTALRYEEVNAPAQTGRTRAFLKIQDGCDFDCSYCIVPRARGKPRSRDRLNILKEANKLVGYGYKEIVLTGVNIGTYEQKTDGRIYQLINLLDELTGISELERVRISSIEVNTIGDEFIKLLKQNHKIARHLHLPLQSASDKILKRMNRKYSSDYYRNFVLQAKKEIPDLCIGADVIVGFPGENDKDFEDTYTFIRNNPIDYLHVFQFSPREGTAAAGMNGYVPFETVRKRSAILRDLSRSKRSEFMESMKGSSQKVIIENSSEEYYFVGHSSNYMKVYIPGGEGNYDRNQIVIVQIKRKYKDGVIGETNIA